MLRGKLLVQIHIYRADEFLTEIALAHEFGYKIRAFHHALEAYKVPTRSRKKASPSQPSATGGATSTKRGTPSRGTR